MEDVQLKYNHQESYPIGISDTAYFLNLENKLLINAGATDKLIFRLSK